MEKHQKAPSAGAPGYAFLFGAMEEGGPPDPEVVYAVRIPLSSCRMKGKSALDVFTFLLRTG